MVRGESQQAFASPEEALTHFGVKGMKWGVRKADRQFVKSEQKRTKAAQLDERSVTSGLIGRRVLQRRARSNRLKSNELRYSVTTKVMAKTNKAAKKDLKEVRKRPEFQNINYRDAKGQPQFDTNKYKALEKEEARIWVGHLNKAVEGQQAFTVKVTGGTWELRPKKIKHADDDEVLRVRPIRDDEGNIIDIEILDDEDSNLTQTVALGTAFLMHYTVQ